MLFSRMKTEMPTPDRALPGRDVPIETAESHFLFDRPLKGPYPDGAKMAMFGVGCFWGAERLFWQLGTGIWVTAVGYAGGLTPNATYKEVCTGQTGHNEVVLVVYEPDKISFGELLKTFWESHDPTQGMRQGNDIGTQYRSGIYTFDDQQLKEALQSKAAFAAKLQGAGFGAVTTEIKPAPTFYFAEADHQQYLAKVPHGYCGLGGTGVSCPIPVSGD